MTLSALFLAAALLGAIPRGQDPQCPDPSSLRPDDEAVIEALALHLLKEHSEKKQSKPAYLLLWPKYSRADRIDFQREIDGLLAWSLGTEAMANLTGLKSSLTDEIKPPPEKIVPLSEMKLDPQIVVTAFDFKRRPWTVRNPRGVVGTVKVAYSVGPPSYSRDGMWALVVPSRLPYSGGSAMFFSEFLKRTPKGWEFAFEIVRVVN